MSLFIKLRNETINTDQIVRIRYDSRSIFIELSNGQSYVSGCTKEHYQTILSLLPVVDPFAKKRTSEKEIDSTN